MVYQPPPRRSLRLANYDYATTGTYFVTVCIQNRACVLGEIVSGEMHLSPVGIMVESHLRMTMDRYAGIELDSSVIMPNHIHALINIGWHVDPVLEVHSNDAPRLPELGRACVDSPDQRPTSLFRIMQWFKSATTNEYSRRVEEQKWPRFPGRLWQAKYYDHVVRDQQDLDRIRVYIVNNPGKWEQDHEYSAICVGFGS